MKKLLITGAMLIAVLAFGGRALADNENEAESNVHARAEVKAPGFLGKFFVKERMEENRQNDGGNKNDDGRVFKGNGEIKSNNGLHFGWRNFVGIRFGAALQNLDNLRTRIANHIETLKDKEVNVTSTVSLMATLDADIAAAKVATANLKAKVDADETASDDIKNLAKEAKDAVVKAYKSLGAVLQEIHSLRVEADISTNTQ